MKKNTVIIHHPQAFMDMEMKDDGFDVRSPYWGDHLLTRILREIHFRLHLPFRSVWYKRSAISDAETIICFDPLMTQHYLSWLRVKCPNSRIILLFANPVTHIEELKRIKNRGFELWSPDLLDCAKYGLHQAPAGGYPRCCQVQKQSPIVDVFFIGRDKGRAETLFNLEKELNARGITTDFHICAEHSNFAPAQYIFKKKRSFYKLPIPYNELLERLGKTRAILHIVDGGQSCMTIRVMESLLFSIKLITNNKQIAEQAYYHPNNIFILGSRDLDELKDFLGRPYEKMDESFLKSLTLDSTFERIIKG
jgi:hypothetical protein